MDGQLAEFSDELWLTLLDYGIVDTEGKLEFMFMESKRGLHITYRLFNAFTRV